MGLALPVIWCLVRRVAMRRCGWPVSRLGCCSNLLGRSLCGVGLVAVPRDALDELQRGPVPLTLVVVVSLDAEGVVSPLEDALARATVLHDVEGLARTRYDATPGTFYLIRPDQHVCARWRRLEVGSVERAMRRALCLDGSA
jgi:3-(3-hydroxy-phenyl)propionate hydroxylase